MAAGSHAVTVVKQIKKADSATTPKPSKAPTCRQWLPSPSKRRMTESLHERPFNLDAAINGTLEEMGTGTKQPETVFYLAYGSNLASETFQGKRGIRPLSQLNVVVPELVMTFDLAGLPYVEPCFANTKYRKALPPPSPPDLSSEKPGLLPNRIQKPKYHKTRWTKGLVGVVYEVTTADFAHIIATEGGGASYQDVLVDCYELSPSEATVPEVPTTEAFKAHTLYSPVYPPGTKPPEKGGRISRPDPDYAQPSARYLKLINDGADEHALPKDYKEYLHQLRPYTITNQKQRLGAFIFGTIYFPFIRLIFGLNDRFADKKGRAPAWLVAITGALFRGMWNNYDGFFYGLFGDGERTVCDDDDDNNDATEEKSGVRSRQHIDPHSALASALDSNWRDASHVV
jgi:hypothetical protein